ncbi:MAG TPA: phospholipase D-like domain-containing protein, partial [Salinisphaeraceae bacterium]|nr:phospholipase D-like domain-containing protein [Salinisphaeraceae bacterium]
LLADSAATIDAMVADIDAATRHVHVLFYIWLADHSGLRVIEALQRAARRGVTCRAMADHIGSRRLIRSAHWQAMQDAGVKLALAMRLQPLRARMDMRNHRKIVVIDHCITYCGSQNCADAAFAVKAKYAPWVDIMLRLVGPVALQNQRLFAIDWMTATGENLTALFADGPAPPDVESGFIAQASGSSAAVRYTALPEMFIALIGAARRELVITTPYYIPDEAIQLALCSAAQRGVEVTIVFPAHNDSWIVAAASRSYYRDLLAAGAHIHEYQPGLLHAKTLTIDGQVALIGSANLDSRSFDLNSENNILLYDQATTAAIRARQQSWLASTRVVHIDEVAAWPWPRRLWHNAVAMSGPLL